MEVMKHALLILVVLIGLVTLFFADKRIKYVSEHTVTVVFTNEHLATLNLEIMSMETKEDALLLSGMGRDSEGNNTPFKMAIPKANILQFIIYSR